LEYNWRFTEKKKNILRVEIKNINDHLIVLDKQIRDDGKKHNTVSEYDDIKVLILAGSDIVSMLFFPYKHLIVGNNICILINCFVFV